MSGANAFFKGKWQSQTFSTNGTFNVPDEVDTVFVEMVGAGGSGARQAAGSDEVYGGEAGEVFTSMLNVTPGASISVTIGSGGTAPATGPGQSDGNDGGSTSFGSYIARGGRGGQVSAFITPLDQTKGIGAGRHSYRGSGGTNSGNAFGGNAGYGNGGNGSSAAANAGNGGIGAGGGGYASANLTFTSGTGGNGICIVWYKKD